MGRSGNSGSLGTGSDARRLKQRLESLAAAGVTDLPRSKVKTVATQAHHRDPVPVPLAADRTPRSPLTHDELQRRSGVLAVLSQEVATCRRCEELACGRTQTVFGAGPVDARICFLGEAPGADEDASGQPFVGRAGELLTKIIESCTLTRNQVYILNVLKCRPPQNRPPLPAEVANCRGYFHKQLEIVDPDYICCLGTTAAQALLESTETIGKLRKRWFTHNKAQVICTYHPSYLLRNTSAKRDVWEDMKMLMSQLGVQLP